MESKVVVLKTTSLNLLNFVVIAGNQGERERVSEGQISADNGLAIGIRK